MDRLRPHKVSVHQKWDLANCPDDRGGVGQSMRRAASSLLSCRDGQGRLPWMAPMPLCHLPGERVTASSMKGHLTPWTADLVSTVQLGGCGLPALLSGLQFPHSPYNGGWNVKYGDSRGALKFIVTPNKCDVIIQNEERLIPKVSSE